MSTYFVRQSKRCRIAKVLLGLVFLALTAAGTAFAQERGLDDLATRLSGTLQEEQWRTVIVADFLGKGERVTLQGVLLADRLWFALLEQEKGFQTLDRGLLQKRLYSEQFANSESYRKAEVDSAHALGADVLIAGSIDERPKDLNISITAWNVSSGWTIKVLTAAVPRTQALDELSVQSVQPNGPVYLVSQSGVSMPACIYCPHPQYSEEARKRKVEGTVVVTAIIGPSGRAEKAWEVKGLEYGLTEQALKIVRQWRFKPGHDAKGNAVTIMVPLDVTFRLM